MEICEDCSRVKLRAEEEIKVWVYIGDQPKDALGSAVDNSYREQKCR